MAYFSVKKQFDTLASNTQGVCFDADYIYVTEASEIMKYTHNGDFVARHDTVGDGSNNHLGDLCIKDGLLYVTSSFYPSTPYNEIIMEYDAATLTYIQEWSTFGAGNDHIGEGIDFRHGYFWTVSDNYDEFYRWEAGFTNPTTYPLTQPTITGSNDHYQTLVWMDDETVATQVHGGPSPALPQGVLVYKYESDSFSFIKRIQVPSPVVIYGQGMAWDAENNQMYFANRLSASPDMITIARLVNDPDGLAFFSKYSIDKVVQQGEVTIVNSGATSSDPLTYQAARIVESTVPNDYGRAGLVRARWSIDSGTNWQALESELVYTFSLTSFSVTLSGLDSAVSIGCDDDIITFRTANGRHGNVGGSPPSSYTPTSRTFIIQYALYERE